MKIIIAEQENCKIGSDGEYSVELCVFNYDFDMIADKITSFVSTTISTKE
jgi:hypothetical protein